MVSATDTLYDILHKYTYFLTCSLITKSITMHAYMYKHKISLILSNHHTMFCKLNSCILQLSPSAPVLGQFLNSFESSVLTLSTIFSLFPSFSPPLDSQEQLLILFFSHNMLHPVSFVLHDYIQKCCPPLLWLGLLYCLFYHFILFY